MFNTIPCNPFPPSSDDMNSSGGGAFNTQAIAPEFNETAQYLTGDLVFYDGVLYRFEEDHDAGAWDSTEVMATYISENLVMLPSDGLRRVGHEFSIKLKSDGKLEFDENGALYTTAGGDNNTYNFNNNTPTQIGKVIKGQNVYPLYRVFAEPSYAIFTPNAEEATANFLAANIIPYPLDERAINIKFFAGDIDVTNTFEFGRVGLNGSTYLQSFSCHMANRVQITKIMVDYYLTT